MVFDDDGGAAGIAITEGEIVVGFAVLIIVTPVGVEDYFSVSTEKYPIGETNAMFHAGVVDEYLEGRGLGSELMRLRLALIDETDGVDTAFSKAWLRPHTVNSSVLFEKYGFNRIDTIQEAYRWEDSKRNCPDCSPESCNCSGAVYAKDFDES